MRVAPAIHLSTETRAELQNLVRRRTTPVRVVERCRIVLLAAEGLQDKQIAERLSDGFTVAQSFPGAWGGRIGEGCAATWPHSDDHRREGFRNRRQDHAGRTGQRHAMVAQQNGTRGRHLRFQRGPHLASARIEAAPHREFQDQQ